jgi:uncharacterized protein
MENIDTTNLPIKVDKEKLAEFCRTHGIRKLSLFGSVLRRDFDPKRSDVDILVEFLPGQAPGWEFFTWHEQLEPLVGRKVDLSSRIDPLVWPYVARNMRTLYERV